MKENFWILFYGGNDLDVCRSVSIFVSSIIEFGWLGGFFRVYSLGVRLSFISFLLSCAGGFSIKDCDVVKK